jgi:carbamoyltransferase
LWSATAASQPPPGASAQPSSSNGAGSADVDELRRQVRELTQRVEQLHRQVAGLRAAPRRVRVSHRARGVARRGRRALRLGRAASRRALFGRALGVFEQYSPRELRLPARYTRELPLVSPPGISIVTPSYNQGRFIEATMRSVLEQEYPRLEYVVQDGGSPDETTEVLARYADRLHHCESRPDDGHAQAVNLGFAHTGGELMAFLNSDDLLLTGALNYVAAYFERHPEVDLVYGHRVVIDADGLEIGRWIMPPHDDDVLSWADWIPQETMFWRRELWERAGGRMDESFGFGLDWDLLLRFRDAGAKAVRLPRFLGAFRVHDAQHTATLIDNIGLEAMERLRTRTLGRTVTREEIRRAVRPYRYRSHLLQKLYRARLLRY